MEQIQMTKTPMEIAMDEKYLIPLRHYCKKAPVKFDQCTYEINCFLWRNHTISNFMQYYKLKLKLFAIEI